MTGAGFKIAIFARAPVAGQCKTRLIPRLGPEGAAELQARLTIHALKTAVATAAEKVELWCSPDVAHPFFAQCAAQFDIELLAQRGADLGARMDHAFQNAKNPLILIGTDSPCITAADLEHAAQALDDGAGAVFLPAQDGGYGLVGLAEPCPEIFTDMVWSTAEVMNETRRRLLRLEYDWRELRTVWDVDEPGDYERLVASGLMGGLEPKA